MTIRVALEHRTTYRFAEQVAVHPHTIRLCPAPHTRTPISDYSLRVEPAGHFLSWQQDPFGNWLARIVLPEPADHLDITVRLVAEMIEVNPFDFFLADEATTYPFAYEEQLREDIWPYLRPVDDGAKGTGPSRDVTAWLEERLATLLAAPADAGPGEGTPTVAFLVGLNRAVREAVDYTTRLQPGVLTPRETLHRGVGSCRDSAWLLVALLRHLGLAARFVSGYLVQLATTDAGPSGGGRDATDLHAWAEVYVPGAGWIGLDATSGLLCGEGHIPLAATPRPASAAPISGTTDPVEVDFSFANSVTRLGEGPGTRRDGGSTGA